METKMRKNVKPESKELVEIDEAVDLDEGLATTRPPDQVSLPQAAPVETNKAKDPLVMLTQFGRQVQQIRPVEPPPKPVPAPRVHQRPSEGFD